MQETWGQAFKRRPLEIILLFTIGLPLLPLVVIYLYISDSIGSASTKKEFNKLSEVLTAMEDELRSSAQSKTEYLHRCMEGSVNKANNRSFFKAAMVEQTKSDLEQLGCDTGVLFKNHPHVNHTIVDDSVERIFLDAESEIDVIFKRISLSENITQTHISEYGGFFNAYQDLTCVFDTDYPQFTDLVKKAYGISRIKLGALLLLQGILSDVDFKAEQYLFPDIDIKEEDFDRRAEFEARDLADAYIDKYRDWFNDDDIQPNNWQFALPFVYDGRITSRMVGSIRRSQREVLHLTSMLEKLDKTEDDFSPNNYCGSMNIYECLLDSNENKQFSEGPQGDCDFPF